MLTRWLVSLNVGVALLSPISNALAQSTLPHGSYVAGELLIGPREGVSDDDLENQYKSHGGKKIKTLSQIKVHHIEVPEHAQEKIEAALRKNPKVEFAEKNFIAESTLAPNDPSYPSQWHLSQISAPGAWDISTGSSGVIIAVLDSGIDTQHPDVPNIVAGKNFITGTTNVYDNGVNYGHGTAVAGTAAAAGNNAIGVAGVSWRNSIMPLVVMDSSAYSPYSVIAAAINHAADNGAKVINMSLAGSSYSTTLQNAVNYAWNKGVVIVAAAANNGSSTPMYPAALENVLAVAATDNSDNRASFSNYGNWIDLAAPGVSIGTTMLGGGYGSWNGTSFATPQVAALAALLYSANPALTNTQVVALMKSNADDLGTPGFDQYFGHGRINASRTLAAAASTSGTTPPPPATNDTTPPSVNIVSARIDAKWVVVNVSASDSQSGVTKVELYVDGKLQSTDTSNPYSFKINIKPWSKGSHQIQVKAYDGTGNVGTSAALSVNKS